MFGCFFLGLMSSRYYKKVPRYKHKAAIADHSATFTVAFAGSPSVSILDLQKSDMEVCRQYPTDANLDKPGHIATPPGH